MLRFNVQHGLGFFRITSDLIPMASHPDVRPPWKTRYVDRLAEIGRFIREHGIRIDMHPGQYTLLNAKDDRIVRNALLDLSYHCEVLDLMSLETNAKVQIHVGGVYGDRPASMDRFIQTVQALPPSIRQRLVVENDERSYAVRHCLEVAHRARIPVAFDVYHHQLLQHGEPLGDALASTAETWAEDDGLPIVDYSSPQPGGRFGRHADTLDDEAFVQFLQASRPHDFDLMLEIKDKETSALRAVRLARSDRRLVRPPAR
jgi:UV DNA damage endonuclease